MLLLDRAGHCVLNDNVTNVTFVSLSLLFPLLFQDNSAAEPEKKKEKEKKKNISSIIYELKYDVSSHGFVPKVLEKLILDEVREHYSNIFIGIIVYCNCRHQLVHHLLIPMQLHTEHNDLER